MRDFPKSIVIKLFFTLILSFSMLQMFAQNNSLRSEKDTLLVGITGSEPFVFQNMEGGIATEIWDKIADKNNWNYKLVHYNNVSDAISAVENNEIDALVGPISITSNRFEKIEFTQPFYNSSISLVSLNQELTLWQKIKPFFSFRLLMAILIFLVILAIVGTLLWVAERKASPDQFPSDPASGIGTGMWLAIVTMTTTGYGDKAPITLAGRIITGVWMVVSLISATSMVAGIASVLTVSSLGKTTITNIEQLTNKTVVTISGSPAEEFLSKHKVKTITVDNINDAISKLKKKEVSAVVYDKPQLLYYLKNNANEDLYISKAEYYKQGYGFAFALNSTFINKTNSALLQLIENQEKERIVHYYIQKEE